MIPVVVVESHHHVLEHIHNVLRRRRLLNQDWSMLHFDAHADLACPNVPVVSCFQPHKSIPYDGKSSMDDTSVESDPEGRNLYESLDATASGIAEWIVPLVLAANLRRVHWVRPLQTIPLIPSGIHRYHVGAWLPPSIQKMSEVSSFLDLPLAARAKVDFVCPYFQEDDSCVPYSELLLSQPLQLTVSERSKQQKSSYALVPRIYDNYDDSGLWMIDICLDFFSFVNPFLRDMEVVDRPYTQAFQRIITQTKFYNQPMASMMRSNKYLEDVLKFRDCLKCLLESYCAASNNSLQYLSEIADALKPFYDTAEVAMQLIDAMRAALLAQKDMSKIDALVEMSIEAIPNATMPHRFAPRSYSDFNSEVQDMLLCFRQSIEQFNVREPFLITVARSADDGFTPKEIVDDLQDAVLREIHSWYCGCENGMALSQSWKIMNSPSSSLESCRLQVAFDFGSWEGVAL